MFRVGFRVCPIHNMGMKGVILEIYEIPARVEMMGGTLAKIRVAKVKLDADQSLRDFKISELMRID